MSCPLRSAICNLHKTTSPFCSYHHIQLLSYIMKFFAPIIFVGVALAASNFTLQVNGGDAESSNLGTAKVIPTRSADRAPSVGFADFGFDTAVLSLDDTGHLEEGFLLRLVEDGVWALVSNYTIQEYDITGPFQIEDTTGRFRYTDSSDLAWAFCSGWNWEGETDIFLAGGSVALGSCLTSHELIATPWTGEDSD
ncbi:hypothetical protein B0J18DRAFT_439842 [Chaetomium sp. MPI-SDFR-AT-0129]|nr:hypothetical protein B0J18DRAFT_439842 [Chaetomium sp. MPI-SDFR-AT-0129]